MSLSSLALAPPAAPAAPARRGDARWHPLYPLVLGLLGLGACYALAAEAVPGMGLVATVGPALLAGACLWASYRLVVTEPLNLWVPIPWFLAACAVYFGIGPLIYTFGSAGAIAELDILWAVSPDDLLRTNMLNLFGILVVLLTFVAANQLLRSLGGPAARGGAERPDSCVRSAVLLFLAIGVPVKYLLVVPYQFGLYPPPVPTSIGVLEDLDPLGLLLLSYLAARCGKGWIVGLVLLFSVDVAIELLRFNKHTLLVLPVVVMLGCFLARRRLGELAACAAGILVCYVVLSPLVSQARQEIFLRHGDSFSAPWSERFEIGREVLASQGSAQAEAEVSEQGSWQRLCYSHVEAFVMHKYDNGSPGDSFAMLGYVLVPRILNPDKPIMTDAGKDLTELAFGHRYSSTGVGVFGEAYWNGGWPMVMAASACVGLLFAAVSFLVGRMMSSYGWPFYIPCVFFGIRFGYRIDGWFVGDYAGLTPIFLVVVVLCFLLASLFQSTRRA
jgi:hypothetical protein